MSRRQRKAIIVFNVALISAVLLFVWLRVVDISFEALSADKYAPSLAGSSVKAKAGNIDQSTVDIALDGSWRPPTVEAFNAHFTQILQTCANGGACAPNADKVVILAYRHFWKTVWGQRQGEHIWCDAVMDSIHALGYSMLMSNGTVEGVHELHRQHHRNTKLILWTTENVTGGGRCLFDPKCSHLDPATYVAPNSTHSILPAWKIFTMHWWGGGEHPLCGKKTCPFTLSPEPYPLWDTPTPREGTDNYYLGYSLEKTCLKTPIASRSERRRQVYVLFKKLSYFVQDHNHFLVSPKIAPIDQVKTDFFSKLSQEVNVTFLASFNRDTKLQAPLGLKSIARMGQSEFQSVVAGTSAILGIGAPPLSPTPWEALCLGVPFINPVIRWDEKKPNDESLWSAQQGSILHMGIREPYVYHVKIGDRAGFERAVTKALSTPIDRYIPPFMKLSALLERTKVLLETDWAPVAEKQLRKLSDLKSS